MYACAHEGVVVSDCVRPSQCIYTHMYVFTVLYMRVGDGGILGTWSDPTALFTYVHSYVRTCMCLHAHVL